MRYKKGKSENNILAKQPWMNIITNVIWDHTIMWDRLMCFYWLGCSLFRHLISASCHANYCSTRYALTKQHIPMNPQYINLKGYFHLVVRPVCDQKYHLSWGPPKDPSRTCCGPLADLGRNWCLVYFLARKL